LAVGLWAAFRLVQLPKFADFLISVEGEMNKVTWPKRGELFRASIVVMVVIFLLAGLLFFYDLVWKSVFGWLLQEKTAAQEKMTQQVACVVQTEEAPRLVIKYREAGRVKEGNFESDFGAIDGVGGHVNGTNHIFDCGTPVELEYWQLKSV